MLESQLAGRMEQLQATVQSKTAVPTAQVYVSRQLCVLSNAFTRVEGSGDLSHTLTY